jgi:tetratricopeptide (TPR) repeat protein
MKQIRPMVFKALAATSLLCAAIATDAQVLNQQATNNASVKEDARAIALQGVEYEREGHYEAALEAYGKALSLAPDAALYNNIGAVYAKLKRYDEAIIALQRSITLKRDFASAHYNLGNVYVELKYYAKAFAELSRAVEINPQYTKPRILLCQVNLSLNRNEEAVACYETLMKLIPPDAELRANYGYALNKTKQYQKSAAILQEIVRLFPDCANAYNNLGATFIDTRRYQQASIAFKRALEIEPDFEAAHYNLALAQLATQNKAAALEQYALLQSTNAELAQQLYKIIYSNQLLLAKRQSTVIPP